MRESDAKVARIAGAQHGVVTRAQMLRAGVDDHAIGRRVRAGSLHRLYPGVFAVGHAGVSLHGRYLAAVLYAGPGAVLSHLSAAHLLRLVRDAPPPPEVTGPTKRRHVEVHRHRLHELDHFLLQRIPVTTVPRTLVDLAASLALDDLARACHEAHVLHRITPAHVDAVIARAPNRPGTATLKAILHGDSPTVLSRLERGFLDLLATHGLPHPVTNLPRNGDRVDCHWPARRLTVELQSYRFHATRHAFEEDLRRERRARAAGDEHRRYAWGDVFEDPGPMLAELRPLLGAS